MSWQTGQERSSSDRKAIFSSSESAEEKKNEKPESSKQEVSPLPPLESYSELFNFQQQDEAVKSCSQYLVSYLSSPGGRCNSSLD